MHMSKVFGIILCLAFLVERGVSPIGLGFGCILLVVDS